MNKKKNIILILLCIILLPNIINAESYSLGSVTNKGNSAEIGIIINVSGDESIKSTDKLSCETNDSNVSCDIDRANSKDYLISDNNVITKGSAFTNQEKIGKITVTNNSNDSISNVTVTLKSSSDKVSDSAGSVVINSLSEKKTTAPIVVSSDAKLKTLTIISDVDGVTMSPEFNSDTKSYVITGLPDTINKITFKYTCDSCSVSISGGSKSTSNTVYLNKGKNDVTITSKSQDNSNSESYNVTIYRGETDYDSAELKELSFGTYKLDPEFSSDVLEYTLTLPKGINTLANIMKYTAKDSEAKVEITGAANLTDEESELVIKVTNQSGKSTNEYKIKIVREEDTETSSIEVIKYKDGKVTFYDEDGNNTELSEDEFKERYPDEWKKIEDGTYKFDEDGNIIKVDNGNNNSNEKKSGLPWWAILLIILGIVAVIVVVILIIRKKKLGNKGPKKDKKDTDKVYSYDDEDSDNYEDNSDENTDEENKETVNNNSESPEDIDDYDEEARMINEEDERIKDLALEDSEEENDEDSKFTDDSDEEDATEEIDKALQDLMNTKEYDFKDKK